MSWIGKFSKFWRERRKNRPDKIKHYLIFCLIILLSLACFSAGSLFAAYPAGSRSVQRHYPAIAKVVGRGPVETNDEGQTQAVYYGSGVYVAEMGNFGLLLTNWHVVNGSQGLLRIDFPSFQSEGAVILVDEVWDLTAIVIRRPNFLPFPISLEVPQIGDELWVAGYGQDAGLGGFQMSSGPVLFYSFPGTNESLPGETLAIGCGVRHGDSGGPILNRYGELAGLLWGSDGTLTTGTFCLRVQAFLTQAQFQLMNRMTSANQFFADAGAGKIEAKRISMPATPASNALVASGVFPISTRPVYRTGNLPTPRKTVPIFYKPAVQLEMPETSEAQSRPIPNAGTDSLDLPTKETKGANGTDEPNLDFLDRRKEYLAAHQEGFTMPPYPAIESPTLLAQRETIGRKNPEVYTAEFLTSLASGGMRSAGRGDTLGQEEVVTTAARGEHPSEKTPANSEEAIVRLTPTVPEGIEKGTSAESGFAAAPTQNGSFQPVSLSGNNEEGTSESGAESGTNDGGVTLAEGDSSVSSETEEGTENDAEAGTEAKKPLREKISEYIKIPLGDVQIIIVVVIILFLFINSMRLLVVAAERGGKKEDGTK